jgi:hypothetical protein
MDSKKTICSPFFLKLDVKPMEKQKKIDVQSIKCIFLRYNETSKAYRFYN